MKNMMIVLFGILMLPMASFALDCKNDRGTSDRYSHCTEFVDTLNDPMHVGYQMEMKYLYNGEVLGTAPICMSSESILQAVISSPPGEHTEVYSMGYLAADGSIEYRHLASQTYYHSGTGLANPSVFTVHLNPGPSAVTCDRGVSPQATELQEYIHIQ